MVTKNKLVQITESAIDNLIKTMHASNLLETQFPLNPFPHLQ